MAVLHLVVLLTVSALLCSGVFAQIDDNKLDLDNDLQANVVVEPPRRRLRPYVRMEMKPAGTVKHVLGEPLVLTCEVMGSPLPSVHWLKNGEHLMEYEEETNEILSIHESSIGRVTAKLPITPSSNLEDVYTCVGNAGLKTKTMSTTVYTERDTDASQLLARLKYLSVSPKPIITMVYSEVLQEMGTNLLVPCQVYSHSKTQVIWSDSNGVPLNFAGHPRIKVLPSGSMLMSNLHWAEMGVYICTAKNQYGTTSANTFIYPMKS